MMPGPGISVMWHSRVRRCWFARERRSTSRCDVRQVRKRNVMRSMANVEPLRRTRKNQKSGRDVREAGWTSLFQAVAEPFSGAWQQGVKADPEAVLSFHAVFACISLISRISPKCGCVLCRRMRMGYAGKRAGDIARLCRRPNAQQNRIQFFELWLNAKLRHGNTVVLKIRNARGRSKNCVFWTGAGLNLWWRMTARCSTASRRTGTAGSRRR